MVYWNCGLTYKSQLWKSRLKFWLLKHEDIVYLHQNFIAVMPYTSWQYLAKFFPNKFRIIFDLRIIFKWLLFLQELFRNIHTTVESFKMSIGIKLANKKYR